MSRDLCYRGNVLNLLNYIELSFGRSKMCYILIPSSNRVIPHCKSILSSDSLGRDGGSVHSGYFPNTLVANLVPMQGNSWIFDSEHKICLISKSGGLYSRN